MMDRRKENQVREYLVPIIVSVVIGAGASYLSTTQAVAVMDERMRSFETRLLDMKAVVDEVQRNRIELAARGQWMTSVESRLSLIELKANAIESNRYTAQDAERDITMLMREIDIRHGGKKEAEHP